MMIKTKFKHFKYYNFTQCNCLSYASSLKNKTPSLFDKTSTSASIHLIHCNTHNITQQIYNRNTTKCA